MFRKRTTLPIVSQGTQGRLKTNVTGHDYSRWMLDLSQVKLESTRILSKIVPGRKCKVCKQKAVINVGFDGWRKRCTNCNWRNDYEA